MPNIGPMEIIVVLIIALVVFGPKRLPELGKSLGKGINEFKGSIGGDHRETEKPVQAVPVAVAPAHAPVRAEDADAAAIKSQV
ncbi:MAG: twin-arginine translocase TatA/TatE family subunit [Solirubrobacterales bacterium]|nr:twin-arginine translocase TatA/TatE family subunit [Solirubrobacterales bacterium]